MNRQQPEARLSGLRGLWQRFWAVPADSRRRIGARAENAAVRYLKRRGYRILERNLSTRLGEIDIVATDGDWLVVVEVRSRREDSPVSPRETLTRQKRRKLRALTEQLRKRHRLVDKPVRVDLVEVTLDQRGKVKSCQLLRGLALEER
jgi:putative endonuclease